MSNIYVLRYYLTSRNKWSSVWYYNYLLFLHFNLLYYNVCTVNLWIIGKICKWLSYSVTVTLINIQVYLRDWQMQRFCFLHTLHWHACMAIWDMRYIYYWNLQLVDLSRFWLYFLDTVVLLLPNTFKLHCIWLSNLLILSVPDRTWWRLFQERGILKSTFLLQNVSDNLLQKVLDNHV